MMLGGLPELAWLWPAIAAMGYRSASSGGVDLKLCESKRLSLRPPIEGQPGDPHELGRGQAEGLAPIEDGFRDLGAQKGQPDQPGDVGMMHALGFGDITDAQVFAHKFLVQRVRPGDELDQGGIGGLPRVPAAQYR